MTVPLMQSASDTFLAADTARACLHNSGHHMPGNDPWSSQPDLAGVSQSGVVHHCPGCYVHLLEAALANSGDGRVIGEFGVGVDEPCAASASTFHCL
jgi:hypothetical protein